jgi:VanZ family protein
VKKTIGGRVLAKLPAPAVAAAIWILSSQSTLPVPKGILGWDKLQHALAFGVLAFASGPWVSPAFKKRHPVLAPLIVFAAASAYGALDEIHQSFVPGRDCNAWDWLADTLGAVFGAAGYAAFGRLKAKKRSIA